jgi:cyanophycinase-like exopeptidase
MMAEAEREVVDMMDVLRQRARSGEPIYVTGTGAGATELAEKVAAEVAAETGHPVQVIQVVDLDQAPKS